MKRKGKEKRKKDKEVGEKGRKKEGRRGRRWMEKETETTKGRGKAQEVSYVYTLNSLLGFYSQN